MENVSAEYPFMLKYARLLAKDHTRQFLCRYRKRNSQKFKELPQTRSAFLNNEDFRNRVTSNLFWLFKNIRLWRLLRDEDWNNLCGVAMTTAWKWYQVLRKRRKPLQKAHESRGLLRDRIRMITPDQCSQLIAGKLPEEYRISTGLYLAQESNGRFTACDYSTPEYWASVEERDGFPRHFVYLPEDGEGWVEGFDNPLDAVDYLLGVSPEDLREVHDVS